MQTPGCCSKKILLLFAVNIPPFFSKEARRLFAVIARGEMNVMEVDFYADLRDLSKNVDELRTAEERVDMNEVNTGNTIVITCSTSPNGSNPFQDDENGIEGDDTDEFDKDDPWRAQVNLFRNDLTELVEDMASRLVTADGNVISAVTKFIMMASHPPTSTISHALHNFGKSDSKL